MANSTYVGLRIPDTLVTELTESEQFNPTGERNFSQIVRAAIVSALDTSPDYIELAEGALGHLRSGSGVRKCSTCGLTGHRSDSSKCPGPNYVEPTSTEAAPLAVTVVEDTYGE